MKRVALAIGAGIVATGAVVASAASLGTLNVQTLGTSSAVVAPCTTNDVDLEWVGGQIDYAGDAVPADSTYTTDTVVVDVPASCLDADLKIAVADDVTGNALASGTFTDLQTGPNTVTLDAAVDTKDIEQTTVTIFNN